MRTSVAAAYRTAAAVGHKAAEQAAASVAAASVRAEPIAGAKPQIDLTKRHIFGKKPRRPHIVHHIFDKTQKIPPISVSVTIIAPISANFKQKTNAQENFLCVCLVFN